MATKRVKNTNGSGKPPKLAETPKFDTKSFLSSVGSGRSTEKYERKEIIFRQGDPADGVFYIQSGKIELSVVSLQGKERVIALLSAGDFFGEGCLAGQPLHMASAIALAESTIFRIEKQTMIRVLRDEPALSEMFMGFLLSRNIQFEADLVDQLFNSSERRLARLLLQLANLQRRTSRLLGKPEGICFGRDSFDGNYVASRCVDLMDVLDRCFPMSIWRIGCREVIRCVRSARLRTARCRT